jgi:hypothetical protein
MQEFPGNSHASKDMEPEKSEPTETETPKKIVTGKITTRRKPLGARLKDMFVSDGSNFVDYLVEKVIVPTIKELVITTINQTATGFQQGIEQKLFGEVRTTRPTTIINRPGGPNGPVSYNQRYNSTPVGNSRRETPHYHQTQTRRRSNEVKDVIFEKRDDADYILTQLDCLTEEQGYCTVLEYYDLVGVPTQSTDADFGWYDLGRARVHQLATDQFVINMPRPRDLEVR